jgi:NAD(P)-dependent dehydrogenase (short-subunit alcohol dehydrogenase family)
MGALDGEVAVVTGGGSGIGRAVVDRFVEEGARVAVADIVEERLDAVRAAHGDAVIGVAADVTRIEENRRIVEQTVDAFGKLDCFVANAGLGDGYRQLVDIPDEDVARACDEIFDLNVKAVVLGAKAALRELARTNGSLIVTLSNSSFYPDGGGVTYIASKHGALGVVRQLAFEWAPLVRVNGVAPGATKTDIRMPAAFGVDENGERIHNDTSDDEVIPAVPLAVYSDPADHAGAYVLLASRRDGIAATGTAYATDGGLGIRGVGRVRGGDRLAERLGF